MVGWSFNRQQFTLFCETNGAAGRSVLDRKNVNFQKRLSPIRQLFMCLASFAVGMRMLGIDKELFVNSINQFSKDFFYVDSEHGCNVSLLR